MSLYTTYQNQSIAVGDTVRVHQEVVEAGKKRVQVFEGVVVAIKNKGLGQTFTVRKIAAGGIGVEKIMPINMPAIHKIEVKRKGNVHRAKLYYLRDRVGKSATKVKEQTADIKPVESVKPKVRAKS